MIGTQPTGRVPGAVICAQSHTGLIVTVDGAPAQLAIITADGRIHAAGRDVAREAEAVAVNAYRAMLQGNGHLRTLSVPIPAAA